MRPVVSGWPLTARGTGAVLLAAVCGFLAQRFGIAELAYVGALLAIVVAVSAATLYLVPRSARVSRSFSPDVAPVGTDVRVRLRVRTRSSLPSSEGRWRDRLPDGIDASPDATAAGPAGVFPATASAVAGTEGVELVYSARAMRRGIRTVGPLSVVSTDPFGFTRRRRSVGDGSPLVIVPEVVELGPLSDLPGDAGGSTRSVVDRLGQGADNLIPRTYAPGDSMRRIHWRASAHRDELMVRQEEQETTPEAVVVLDRGAPRWPVEAARAPGGDPGFEIAVSACLSATALLVREGYLVTVIDADGAVLADPIEGGDGGGVEQLAIALATVTARRDLPLDALVRLFTGISAGPVVLVTGAIDDADAAALAALPHHSTLPVLLTVAVSEAARARAVDTGWRLGVIAPGADLASAWSDAVAATSTPGGGRAVA
ncbi:DUF58 domain-containing protein [Microbacterium sp. PAMC21962]|nr:DUF58 domain-containing protein [Microbacterium hominis]QYF99315.1 DUF58 domain-containing protein [Microbacterium sp. PAMC21962]